MVQGVTAVQQLTAVDSWVEAEPVAFLIGSTELKTLELIFGREDVNVLTVGALPCVQFYQQVLVSTLPKAAPIHKRKIIFKHL